MIKCRAGVLMIVGASAIVAVTSLGVFIGLSSGAKANNKQTRIFSSKELSQFQVTTPAINFYGGPSQMKERASFEYRRRKQPASTTVMAEDLTEERALTDFCNPLIDRGQRNEAGNYLRDSNRGLFLKLCGDILQSDRETDLFKTWIIQHLGYIAKELNSSDSRYWSQRILDLIKRSDVGSPVWREGIYALSYFSEADAKAELIIILENITTQEKVVLKPLLNDVYKNIDNQVQTPGSVERQSLKDVMNEL